MNQPISLRMLLVVTWQFEPINSNYITHGGKRDIIDTAIDNIVATDFFLGPQSNLYVTMDTWAMKAVAFMLFEPNSLVLWLVCKYFCHPSVPTEL